MVRRTLARARASRYSGCMNELWTGSGGAAGAWASVDAHGYSARECLSAGRRLHPNK